MTGADLVEPEELGRSPPADCASWRILFRYSPIAGVRSGLDLRYRCEASPAGGGDKPRIAAVGIRWRSDTGRILLWQMPHRTMRLCAGPGWTPFPLPLPLPPRDCRFLRFDIIVEHEGERLALCSGFVQPGVKPADDDADVLALAAVSGGRAAFLPGGARAGPVAPLSARRLGPEGSGLLIVEADASAGLSALHLANWPGAARRLLEAPVRAAGPDARALLALPEAGLAASEARVWAEHRDGHLSPARIRIASARPAPTGDGPCHERRVSVVVTSCGRQDLLGKTLDSFFACNTYPIAQIIIVEDGPAEANASLARKYDGRNITWLATGRQSGQIAAIDFAYAFVETPYIFHLEDDWQFYQAGFIEKSLVILEAVPACLQVWIRAFNDTNRQPIAAETETVDGVACRKILAYLDKWHGFSFNPGLRRTGDYDRIGQYGWHVRYDRADPDASEWRLSALYKEMGFYAVILADDGGKGYVRHLGFGRRVVDRGAVSR